eukprot:14541036-Alexandrium_andersonii.AAC.1
MLRQRTLDTALHPQGVVPRAGIIEVDDEDPEEGGDRGEGPGDEVELWAEDGAADAGDGRPAGEPGEPGSAMVPCADGAVVADDVRGAGEEDTEPPFVD